MCQFPTPGFPMETRTAPDDPRSPNLHQNSTVKLRDRFNSGHAVTRREPPSNSIEPWFSARVEGTTANGTSREKTGGLPKATAFSLPEVSKVNASGLPGSPCSKRQ